MTQKRYTEIPKRQKCINKEEPYIGGAEDIVDDTLGKPQSEVNQDRIEDVATLDGKIALEKQRAEGVESGLNNRLGTVEQLAEISIGGGDAQIATGADFTNPDATKRAKIPTVGAIVDGLNDGVYDVSKRNPTAGPNSDGKFTLDYILSNADTLIPTGWRHGGMIISFVDSSDNKYVQYRLMATDWSTIVSDWQGVDDEPTAGSENLVKSNAVERKFKDLDNIVFGIVPQIGFINFENLFNPNRGSGFCIPVNGISTFKFLSVTGSIINYAFLKKNVYNDGLEFCVGYEARIGNPYNSLADINIPADCEYIWFCTSTASTTYSMSTAKIIISGVDVIKSYFMHLTEIANSLDAVKNKYEETVYSEVLNNVDGDAVTINHPFQKKHKYLVKLTNYDCSNGTLTKIKFGINYLPNGSSTNIYLLQLVGNVNYSGLTTIIETPDPEIVGNYAFNAIYCRANSTVKFSIIDITELSLKVLQDEIEPNVLYYLEQQLTEMQKSIARSNIDAASNTQVTQELNIIKRDLRDVDTSINFDGFNADIVNVFINSSNAYRQLTDDKSYIKEISAGDVVKVGPKSTNVYNYVAFVKTYPVVGANADYMTGLAERISFNEEVEITAPEDGYVIIVKTTNLSPEQDSLGLWTINGENVYVTSINTKINNLEQEDIVLEAKSNINKVLGDHGMFALESDYWIKDKYLEDTYAATENDVVNAFIAKLRTRRKNNQNQDIPGIYQIAVISDTHGSGAYSWRNILKINTGDNNRHQIEVCHRSIAVFNKIAAKCNAAIHGGDISCDYGTSRLRYLQYMYEVIRMFSFNRPFFITKGNHDENNNEYEEADILNLDWANNTYYKRNFSTFTAITESEWDGSPLYVHKKDLLSDREFRNVAQHWLCPSGAVWGNGAYYYYDVEVNSCKIRVIVANSFPVNDNHNVSEDEEYLWFAQTALNFSDKGTVQERQEWHTIVIRHTQSTGSTKSGHIGEPSIISDCINAFRAGSTWTYNDTTVDFGSNTMNGGAMTLIAHIHGHEHGNVFSNGAGYFDIGVNEAFVEDTDLGDATKYGISVWTIDTINKKVYEDTIDGKAWIYNYANERLEIKVNDTFVCAESSLSRPVTASSSDRSKADILGIWKKSTTKIEDLYTDAAAQELPHGEGSAYAGISEAEADGWVWKESMKIKALSTGDLTITVNGANSGESFEYPITVVES